MNQRPDSSRRFAPADAFSAPTSMCVKGYATAGCSHVGAQRSKTRYLAVAVV
jgi:hypothetical protein